MRFFGSILALSLSLTLVSAATYLNTLKMLNGSDLQIAIPGGYDYLMI